MTRGSIVAIVWALLAVPAVAQDVPQSVSQLVNDQHFEIKGVIPSNAGPGILLARTGKADDGSLKTELTMCFVAETPESPTIKTQYCKRVE